MENNRKTQTFNKLRNLVKRKNPKPSNSNPGSPQLESVENTQEDTHNAGEEYVDRQQVRARYVQAATLLQDAMRKNRSQEKSFDFPDLSGEMEEWDSDQRNLRSSYAPKHNNQRSAQPRRGANRAP